MAHSVLILDDDADFNSLLTDIFKQADYVVRSLHDPFEAIEVFTNSDYDLVVTDHKMPGMVGSEFVAQIKQIKPQIPVIMVSGFLENDTVRELINNGVGGVFLKPLNIFSLLERTTELIDEAKRLKQNHELEDTHLSSGAATGAEQDGNPGLSFRSFPGQSPQSVSFVKRLYRLRNFRSTLSLIGPPGTAFGLICDDIRSFYDREKEYFVYLSASSFDTAKVLAQCEIAKQSGFERITCVLLDIEFMSDAQKCLAVSLAKCVDAFEHIDPPLRTIFCVSNDLDTLFDEARINEDLYILMRTAEVKVPALRDCVADISILTQQIVGDIATQKKLTKVPRLAPAAEDFLAEQTWNHNYEQLHATLRYAMHQCSADVISLDLLVAALQANMKVCSRDQLEQTLAGLRLEYVQAVSILSAHDSSAVSAFFGTDTTVIEAIVQ